MTSTTTPEELDIQPDAYLSEQYMATGAENDSFIYGQIRILRQYLPHDAMLLYAWYVARALHPERPHDGLAGVRRRLFKGNARTYNRARRRLVAWGLLEIYPGNEYGRYETVIVKPTWFTHRGKAALR